MIPFSPTIRQLGQAGEVLVGTTQWDWSACYTGTYTYDISMALRSPSSSFGKGPDLVSCKRIQNLMNRGTFIPGHISRWRRFWRLDPGKLPSVVPLNDTFPQNPATNGPFPHRQTSAKYKQHAQEGEPSETVHPPSFTPTPLLRDTVQSRAMPF
ncbi:hypothetical protein B0T21DRAFT_446600 [Apiosordaria backusii]|uniref:Uncharacterized protein n=1 Tax=Apiosordaria backusii TaxID=314023 RepID=A0AA40EY85_9PEZI|nr:hypothetical protein B0T21DRAFT_446600 [Apiosordaria backusii]